MAPSTSPRTVNDFHVGWICALQCEFVAACELLDEEYPALDLDSHHDSNTYQFGRFHHHNVVIACLPKGRYGLTSATSLAKDMLHSFPAMRFGLMVGIGGGAPSRKHDIRLGDVVVSSPTGNTGGVIHYEFGKTIQQRRFQRTGSLEPPPIMLLAAIQKIAALHERRGHQIVNTVEELVRRNRRLKTKYARPDLETDRLYKSSFVHPDDDHDCKTVCHERHLMQRSTRTSEDDNPTVHYGLIASADRLLRDAETRDKLAQDEDVLCFEMEAAGLMGYFPCLVIRGICDYSDTHKNDIWQGYAAGTAAAYAKELLSVIPQMARTASTIFDARHNSAPISKLEEQQHNGSPSQIAIRLNEAKRIFTLLVPRMLEMQLVLVILHVITGKHLDVSSAQGSEIENSPRREDTGRTPVAPIVGDRVEIDNSDEADSDLSEPDTDPDSYVEDCMSIAKLLMELGTIFEKVSDDQVGNLVLEHCDHLVAAERELLSYSEGKHNGRLELLQQIRNGFANRSISEIDDLCREERLHTDNIDTRLRLLMKLKDKYFWS